MLSLVVLISTAITTLMVVMTLSTTSIRLKAGASLLKLLVPGEVGELTKLTRINHHHVVAISILMLRLLPVTISALMLLLLLLLTLSSFALLVVVAVTSALSTHILFLKTCL